MNVKLAIASDSNRWDNYVSSHKVGNIYHFSVWRDIIEKTYNHKTYYFLAEKAGKDGQNCSPVVVGIFPLVHMKHFIFGNSLVSLPFFDFAGILANDRETESALLAAVIELGKTLKVDCLELRQTAALQSICNKDQFNGFSCHSLNHKVRMLIELPENSETMMKEFKAKLRSQIKKPVKHGLHSVIGGKELLNDFYNVFLINMRDLGSPVHSRELFNNIFKFFADKAVVCMVYDKSVPVAGSIMLKGKTTLKNPWASSLRSYSKLSPNMLLYWTMLKFACDNSFTSFDFGRSSPKLGSYKFKEQWGARPYPLNWSFINITQSSDQKAEPLGSGESAVLKKAVKYWQMLPVPVTKVVGPAIRKYISL